MTQSLKEAVQEYIISKTIVSPYDLVNDLLPKYYPVSDLVLDAAKYFTTIVRRSDMCVQESKLSEYGILNLRANRNKLNATDIEKMINQYGLIDNTDYNRRNVPSVRKTGKVDSIEYTLTSKAFFICLVRSKNSFEYAKYYLFECN